MRIIIRAPVHKPEKTDYQEVTLAVMRFGGANIFKHGLQPVGGLYKRNVPVGWLSHGFNSGEMYQAGIDALGVRNSH